VTQTIGSYEVLGRLGSGGMAEVFLARSVGEEGFEKRVAIKRMHPDLCREDSHIQTFADEARLVAQLNHPNIVHVYAFERDGPSHYLVMEYIKGVTLARAVQKAHEQRMDIPADVAAAIGVQVCDALAYAHSARTYDGEPMHIVHRDIKPANVMLTSRGQVKITDFGVARATTNLHQTLPGTGKGTLAYMAPEQLEGENIGPHSDLFSLGVVLFELFAGRRLFEDTGLSKFLERRKEGVREADYALLRAQLADSVPVLEQSLAHDPAGRFPDAAAMGDALRALPCFRGRGVIEGWLQEVGAREEPMDALVTTLTSQGIRAATLVDSPGSTGRPRGNATEGYTTTSLSSPGSPASPTTVTDRIRLLPLRGTRLPLLLAAAVAIVGLITLWPPCGEDGSTVAGEELVTATVADGGETGGTENVEPVTPLEPDPPEPTPAEVEPVTAAQLDPPNDPTPPEDPTPAVVEMAIGTASLTVTTDPWGEIYVDEQLRATEGLLQNLQVDLGTHRIRVVPADGATPEGYFEIEVGEDGEQLRWRFEYHDDSWHARHR
jgi:serine/threonine protein kinase